jgi:hypothetical protein
MLFRHDSAATKPSHIGSDHPRSGPNPQ